MRTSPCHCHEFDVWLHVTNFMFLLSLAVATYQIGLQACPPQNLGQNFDPATHRFATIELHPPQPAAYVTTQPATSETQQNANYGWEKTATNTNEADRTEFLENSISKCPDCNAEFSSTIALGLHRFRAHNYNRKYTCKTCKKGFANARNLKQHMLRHLNIRPFRCHCESTFKTKPDLQAHQRLVHSVEDRQRIKERIKRTSSWRKASVKNAPGVGTTPPEPDEFRCVDCGQVYTTPSALGDHRIKIHQTQQVYKCHFCGENFGHARSLKVHMTRHSATKSVPVPIPEPPRPPPQRGKKNQNKNTASQEASRMHGVAYGQPSTPSYQQNQRNVKPTQNYGFGGMTGHTVGNETWSEPPKPSKRSGNYVPKCYHCNIEFESAISLGLHRFRFHNTGRKNICEICNKGFANARNLKDHMFRHLNIRPFKCESCDLSFKTKQDLSNHNLYLHSAESKDRRQQMAERRTQLLTGGADQSGSHQQQQQQQQVVQTSSACDSPSSENTMGSNISSAGSPQSAKGAETLIFKCTDCQEEFTSAPNLGDHRAQVHQAADLFKCHVCSKSFVNGNGLKEHMKRHTEARNFRCELCGSGFKVKLDLKQHHYLVHTEDGRRRLHENYARSRAKKQQQQAQKEAADAAALLEVTWSDDDNTSEINVEDQESSAQRV